MAKKRVLVLFTGGTLGMVSVQPREGGRPLLRVSAKTPSELKQWFLKRVPELPEIAECRVEMLLNRDSAHMGPDEWGLIANRIRLAWKEYDGVVVLHGTDTLVYTASALSFLLRPCLKPVVVTGAQKPLSTLRSDAKRNLLSAVEIAATASQSPDPRVAQGVTVFFDHLLLQGNRARKRSPSEFFGFDSPKLAPLAEVGTEISYHFQDKKKMPWPPRAPNGFKPQFCEKIVHLHLTPGFPARRLMDLVTAGFDGILLQVYQSGTGPTHMPGLLEFLDVAKNRRVPVVLVSEGTSLQAHGGANPAHYAAGQPLIDHGGIWAGSMTPECAYVKMSWILAQKDGKQKFRELWRTDFAGEGVAE